MEFNAIDDLEIFSKVIAKAFDIQIRFAGEEPIYPFTRKYNQEMQRILPRYGIEFNEIPRKELNGNVISATRVRNLMKNNEWDKIKELVMPNVYDYLINKYKL